MSCVTITEGVSASEVEQKIASFEAAGYFALADAMREVWRDRQLEEVRKRSFGYMTATECLLAMRKSNEEIMQHTGLWMIPALCSPWGRIMP